MTEAMSGLIDLIARILTSPLVCTYAPQALIINFAAAKTDRGSNSRLACFIAVVGIYVAQLRRLCWLRQPISHTWVAAAAGGLGFWNCVTFFDRLIARAWDYEHYYPPAKPKSGRQGKSETTFRGTRAEFANEAVASARGVGTWWEVKGVPANRTKKLTRAWFCASRGIAIIFCWFAYNALVEVLFSERYGKTAFALDVHETWLRELEVRVMTTWNHYTRLYLAMNLFTMLAMVVSCLIDGGETLRNSKPLFGAISDSYTLRLFWGKFWHQNIRSGCEGMANYVVHQVARLPRHGYLQRYSKVFASFALSGVLHIANDLGLGVPLNESGALSFFLLQAIGFVIEDAVQATWRTYVRRESGRFERWVGYAWTALYLSWTAPHWIYPGNRYLTKEATKLRSNFAKPIFVDARAQLKVDGVILGSG